MPVYPYADSRLKGDDLGKQESLWYAGNNLAKAKEYPIRQQWDFSRAFSSQITMPLKATRRQEQTQHCQR